MEKSPSIIERINRYAEANGILPATVVRKATGDSRGLDRLLKKLEDIEKVEKWLDLQEGIAPKITSDDRHALQAAEMK